MQLELGTGFGADPPETARIHIIKKSPMKTDLSEILDLDVYPIDDQLFGRQCRQTLTEEGVLVLPGFVRAAAVERIKAEGKAIQQDAYYTQSSHNVYLAPSDKEYPEAHCRNRLVESTKGCVTTDQIPSESLLHTLYGTESFKNFLCEVLEESGLYEYADQLSSINMHYASEGQELGWHFDNSSFAITLLIQKPAGGGEFQYVKDVRDADAGDMNFEQTEAILSGDYPVESLTMDPGTLVLFRGRNSMHRVTPVTGDTTRMLVVLAYNSEPGIALSESASNTFYGRYLPH